MTCRCLVHRVLEVTASQVFVERLAGLHGSRGTRDRVLGAVRHCPHFASQRATAGMIGVLLLFDLWAARGRATAIGRRVNPDARRPTGGAGLSGIAALMASPCHGFGPPGSRGRFPSH